MHATKQTFDWDQTCRSKSKEQQTIWQQLMEPSLVTNHPTQAQVLGTA